jgi:negative regulator of sigma E activity
MQPELTAWQARYTNAASMRALQSRRGWWSGVALGAVAMLALLALLAGLTQVLLTSVQQGEAMRATTRQQGEAYWGCNSLGTAAERHACRHESLQPGVEPARMPEKTPPAASRLMV